jgi:tripartite-type tricarboxylate transporter receptor subunit TctC
MTIEREKKTMMRKRRYQPGRFLAPVVALFVAIAAFGSANAQFPERDITFIVPYSPGGGSDQQARRLQAGLEKALGVGLKIVYKTGGGGAVGFLELHSSKPDGYTISNVVVPNIIVTSKGDDVGYKPDDFAYIGMTDKAIGALVVPKDSQFKSLEDLVAYAKENPGKLTVAGTGSTGQANYAELAQALGVKATYVPVSGGVGKILPFLQGGHVDAAVFSSSHAVRHAATVRAVGVAGPDKSPAMPDVPTAASVGFDGFNMATTWGIMAPPGTPDDVVKVLNAALQKAVSDPDVKAAQVKNGLTPMSQTPEEAREYVMGNIARVDRITELVKALDK